MGETPLTDLAGSQEEGLAATRTTRVVATVGRSCGHSVAVCKQGERDEQAVLHGSRRCDRAVTAWLTRPLASCRLFIFEG